MPGDPSVPEMVERIIRVDQAGEYGAKRIYEGQLAVLGKSPVGETIRHMAEQEAAHLERLRRDGQCAAGPTHGICSPCGTLPASHLVPARR